MRHIFFTLQSILLFIIIGCSQSTVNQKQTATHQTTSETKPNVIVVLVDDLGYADVSFNGSQDISTPNIDRIAQNGVKFTSGYVSYAVCGPSRAGLITGRYQDRFGFGRNPLFAPKDITQGLPLSEQTIAEVLKPAGYKNVALGKWHLGSHEKLRPLKRGFDEFFGFLSGGHKYFPEDWDLNDISEVKSQFEAYRTKLLRNDTRIDEKEYLTHALSREAVSFIEKNQKQPFFMYLAYNAPHTPLQAPQEYIDRFKHIEDKDRRIFAGMVGAVDDGVGRILDKLEELKMDENTIVFFLSDNGGSEKHAAENGVLRGQKGSMLEGGIRVPFAMQWKGKIAAGTVYDNPVISLDILGTIAHYASAQPKNKLDGVNIVPYINGEVEGVPHQQLCWRKYDYKHFAVRKGNFKIVKDKKQETACYDLSKDISEQNALTENKADVQQAYDNWVKQMKDPDFLGLRADKKYNKQHPDRFKNVEKY